MIKSILWIIAARSGSKTIPHKNIKELGGVPLLVFKVKAALRSSISKDVWISTDSINYANIAKEYGAFVPFLRPSNLSGDFSSSIDVVLHAMDFANQNHMLYNYIGLLEPTSPFITTEQLDSAVEILSKDKVADSIVSVRESRPNTIFIQNESQYLDGISLNLKNLKKTGRQNFKKQVTPSGGFYISKWDNLIKNRSFYTTKTIGFEVDDISGLEIDKPIDFDFANFIVNKYKNDYICY